MLLAARYLALCADRAGLGWLVGRLLHGTVLLNDWQNSQALRQWCEVLAPWSPGLQVLKLHKVAVYVEERLQGELPPRDTPRAERPSAREPRSASVEERLQRKLPPRHTT